MYTSQTLNVNVSILSHPLVYTSPPMVYTSRPQLFTSQPAGVHVPQCTLLVYNYKVCKSHPRSVHVLYASVNIFSPGVRLIPRVYVSKTGVHVPSPPVNTSHLPVYMSPPTPVCTSHDPSLHVSSQVYKFRPPSVRLPNWCTSQPGPLVYTSHPPSVHVFPSGVHVSCPWCTHLLPWCTCLNFLVYTSHPTGVDVSTPW